MFVPIVIYGTHVWRRRLGWVAGYCPICRMAQRFRLFKVQVVRHFFYLPIAPGRTAGHEVRCQRCGQTMETLIDTYPDVTRDRHLPIEQLIDLTCPTVWEQLEERQAMYERYCLGVMSADERDALLAEPLRLIEPELDARASGLHSDRWTTPFALAAVGGAVYLTYYAGHLPRHVRQEAGWALALSSIVIIALLVSGDARRYAKRKLLPRIAPALAAYQPTRHDIKTILDRFRRRGLTVGKRLRPRDVMAAVGRVPEEG